MYLSCDTERTRLMLQVYAVEGNAKSASDKEKPCLLT